MSDKKKLNKILLVMCPFWGHQQPPLGLAYLYSYLKAKGHTLGILDINIDMYNSLTEENKLFWGHTNFIYWMNYNSLKANIVKRFNKQFNFYRDMILAKNIKTIGFSTNIANLIFSFEIAKRIKEKKPDTIIIFGGPQTAFFTPYYLNSDKNFLRGVVDIIIKGEGEETLDEVLRRIERQETVSGIPGTAIFKDGYYRIFAERKPIPDLDSLPFPDFESFKLDRYGNRKLPIIMGRGCPGRCRFCTEPFFNKNYRGRTAMNVFKEVLIRAEKYKIKTFEFLDPMFNSDLKRLGLFCDLLIRHRLKISWDGQASIRKNLSQDLLIKMKRAGCEEIVYGVETFSDKVLRAMNKPYSAEDAIRILKFTKKAGINAYINIIIGFPGEGEAEFNETVGFFKKNHKLIKGVNGCNPCTVSFSSDLQRHPDKYGIIIDKDKDFLAWRTLDGRNNAQTRKKRFQKLLLILSKLKVPCRYVFDRVSPYLY